MIIYFIFEEAHFEYIIQISIYTSPSGTVDYDVSDTVYSISNTGNLFLLIIWKSKGEDYKLETRNCKL